MSIKDLLNFTHNDKSSTVKVCLKCGANMNHSDLYHNYMICPQCNGYMRMGALDRLEITVDKNSFKELNKSLKSIDPINFPGYSEKLEEAKKNSSLSEAVICGTADIFESRCAIFVMDSNFMMGSMGSVVGEKITRLFETATQYKLPVVGFITSGGARMQEGIFSLMQMAKISGAVKKHSNAGNLYISVLTDPTTGGVTASFAMQGDIIIAEPHSLIGFAGARVIEQTTGEKLPDGFQRAEFLLEHGFIDVIEDRRRLKYCISNILKLHHIKELE